MYWLRVSGHIFKTFGFNDLEEKNPSSFDQVTVEAVTGPVHNIGCCKQPETTPSI